MQVDPLLLWAYQEQTFLFGRESLSIKAFLFVKIDSSNRSEEMKLMHEVRGLRNANPGNIRKSNTKWNGEVMFIEGVEREPDFCQFSNMDYGIRAIFITLRTYKNQYNIDTISDIIGRWAPSNENNTDAYIDSVCSITKIDENQELSGAEYSHLVYEIIRHENGFNPFTFDYIESLRTWSYT